MYKHNIKIPIMICLFSLMLIYTMLFVGCAGMSNDTAKDQSQNTPSPTFPQTTTPPAIETTTPHVIETLPPLHSIFPDAWRNMNAILIEWGNRNGEEYSHRYNADLQINYVGIEVKYLKVYTETTAYYFDFDPESPPFSFIMIPDHCLSQAVPGETSLVFIGQLMGVPLQDGRVMNVPCVYADPLRSGNGFIDSPIFAVSEDKITIPNSAYATDDGGSYLMNVMSLLTKANDYAQKYYVNDPVSFRDGASLQELERLFEYCCKGEFSY